MEQKYLKVNRIEMNLIYTNEGVIPRAEACPNAKATFDVGRDVNGRGIRVRCRIELSCFSVEISKYSLIHF